MAGDWLRPRCVCESFLNSPVPGLVTLTRARAGLLMRSISYSACSTTQPCSVGLMIGLLSWLELDSMEKEVLRGMREEVLRGMVRGMRDCPGTVRSTHSQKSVP